MSTITFDFRHHYVRGERRESEQIAYQWDLGHVMNVFVPEDATYTIGYCFGDYEKTEDYAIDTKVQDPDGGYKLTAHIPNKYFERSRELRVYVVGSADDHIITTYEGFITIRGRIQPDDYVDDDPENGATQIIEVAREYATKSESFAVGGTGTRLGEDTDNAKYYLEQAEAVAESIPEDYSELSDDVDQLKNALGDITGCTPIEFSDPSLHEYIQTNGEIGTTVDFTPSVMSTAGAWAVVECSEGQKFTINGKGGNADRMWCFLDAEKKITRVAGISTTATNLVLTARTGEAYLVLNDRTNKVSFVGEITIKSVEGLSDRLNKSLELDNDFAQSLSGTSNIDTLLPGNYIVPNSTVATALGLPMAGGGKLYCLYQHASNRLLQIFIYTNRLFIRNNNGTWQTWTELMTTSNMLSLLKNETLFVNTSANTAISANSDLDSYTDAGSYSCSSSSTAETLAHCPVTVAFRMIVMDLASSTRKCQILIQHSVGNIRMYIRYYDGSWHDWLHYVMPNETIEAKNIVVSNSSQLSDYDDAPVNSILAMNRPQIPNGPDGDNNLVNADTQPGYQRGILMTYSPQTGTATYKVQIFVGYYASITDKSPIIDYRFAISSGGVWSWSPWAKFSQDRFLGATNVVLRASTVDQHFTDLNDAPINTIYQIDMDCVAGVLANHPAPGYSAVLMTYGYALGTRHGMVQEVYSLQSSKCVKYFRYGWLNATDDYRWTAWEKVTTETVGN